MKQLTCEMCGSTDLMKDGGVFVCQTCGCKYSIEEARKMMVEGTVEVQGVVQVANTAQISNLMNMARSAFDSKNFAKAEEFCDQVISMDDKNYDAWMLKGRAINYQINANNPRILEVYNCLMTSYRILGDDYTDDEKVLKKLEITNALKECMEGEVAFWVRQIEVGRPTEQAIKKAKDTYIDCYNKMKAAYEEMGFETEKYLKSFDTFFCSKCNGVCVDAWESTVGYNYFREDFKNLGKYWNRDGRRTEDGTDYFRPSKEIWQTFIKETDQLIALLNYCIEQFNDETPLVLKKNIYSNIAYFYETTKDQVGYQAMVNTTTNGYGAVVRRREYYKICWGFTDDAIKARTKLAEHYRANEAIIAGQIKMQEALEQVEKAMKEQEEKKKRIAEYWEAHADEKQSLEQEKESLTAQMDSIKEAHQQEISALEKEKDEVPGGDEISHLADEITKLKKELESLGVFKFKEKKNLQNQIEALEKTLTDKKAVRSSLENEVQKRIDAASNETNVKLAPIQKRLEEINDELTKDR